MVSTFRLGRDVSPEKMLLRTGRVTAHEIGHTFGLPHCPTPHCLMHDAGGNVKEVDESTGDLCPVCREKVRGVARD
ncbi:MAG: matrixin family metalloprotease [Chthoniobacter sp.]|nr:matrixin family metalloprotease [Chthoniobacter sp.]